MSPDGCQSRNDDPARSGAKLNVPPRTMCRGFVGLDRWHRYGLGRKLVIGGTLLVAVGVSWQLRLEVPKMADRSVVAPLAGVAEHVEEPELVG